MTTKETPTNNKKQERHKQNRTTDIQRDCFVAYWLLVSIFYFAESKFFDLCYGVLFASLQSSWNPSWSMAQSLHHCERNTKNPTPFVAEYEKKAAQDSRVSASNGAFDFENVTWRRRLAMVQFPTGLGRGGWSPPRTC